MKIKEKLSQHRRDFTAIYECDHDDCDHAHEGGGYDDSYYHEHVIPDMICPKCKRNAKADYKPQPTKYPDGKVV